MLKSITSEIKIDQNQDRELVFSNCEVEHSRSRKSLDKYAHCKALFNFNKQLMIETSDAATTKNMTSGLSSTNDLPGCASAKNGLSSSTGRPPLSTRSAAVSRRNMTA